MFQTFQKSSKTAPYQAFEIVRYQAFGIVQYQVFETVPYRVFETMNPSSDVVILPS